MGVVSLYETDGEIRWHMWASRGCLLTLMFLFRMCDDGVVTVFT